jgi:long-chain acyl-CoA synthetase
LPTTEKPWLAHYDPGVRATLAPYPDRTLLDYFDDAARERADAPSLLFKGGAVSFAELNALANACAAAFAKLGLRRGDRVALLLPNCPQFVIAQLAAWRLGAVIIPLNPIYSEEELHGPLVLSGAETIVVLTPFYERLCRAAVGTAIKHVIATNIKEYLPPLLRVLFTLFKEKKDGHRVTLAPGHRRFDELLAANRGAAAPTEKIGPDDLATLLLTGGTTGVPKCAMMPHHSYVMAGLQLRAWLGDSIKTWESPIMLPLPLFHVYANVGVQSVAFVTRNPMVLVPNPRDQADLLKSIQRTRPAFFCGVPTLYSALINHPDVVAGKVDFRSMKACVSGSSPLLAETKQRFEALTGGRILEAYGLTESGMAVTANPMLGENKIGSVGMPVTDVEVRIVDGDAGARALSTGEVGEIIMRAPNLMRGYWHNDGETRQTIRSFDSTPWLFTGDLGKLDGDGYLFIVDRKKDLIKSSGYQVWPREVEEAIAKHPAVAEVGVVGAPDPAKGEVVEAYVVLRPGMTATADELRAFCREHLAPYKVPARIEFRTDLPKSMVGKILRRMLREPAAAAPALAPAVH